jgi:cystathionine gamma-synthase
VKRETLLAQAGNKRDPQTGAVSMPIYQSATFGHPALGESTGFDYSRSANPTRQALEETLATLESGHAGFAFSSGLAAIDCLLHLFKPGDKLIVTQDLYGGTFRLLEEVYKPLGIEAIYVDTSNIKEIEAAWEENVKAIFVESPTNPLLKVADIKAISRLARTRGALSIIDNTFFTPVIMRPLELGADIVVYSASKYLSGHNDVIAGAIITKNEALSEKIYFLQNSIGAVLGPQDSWLILRGLKTLSLRLK